MAQQSVVYTAQYTHLNTIEVKDDLPTMCHSFIIFEEERNVIHKLNKLEDGLFLGFAKY